MTQAANSALQGARLRFVEGLPARAEELSITAERLGRDPGDQEAAAMLRRRLHALLASAQVFEERALALAVQDLIARLDVAQRAERAFTREEIDAVGLVVASIPTYVRPSLQPPAAYSDVRELLGGVHDRPTIRPAAVSGESWRPPAQDRVESGSWGVEASEQGLGPVLLAKAESGSESGLNPEIDRDDQPRERALDEEFVNGSGRDPAQEQDRDRDRALERDQEQAEDRSREQGPAPDPQLMERLDPELDRDEYLPASLADSRHPAANDLGFGAEPFERPLPPRARRIIALSALQPGTAQLSGPTPEPAALEVAKAQPSAPLAGLDAIQPISAETRQAGWAEPTQAQLFDAAPTATSEERITLDSAVRESVEVPSVRPLPTPRDSIPGESVQLFADTRSELQAEVGVDTVSQIVRTLATPGGDAAPEPANDSWSQAVAAVGEELAAWRDSLQPDPIANIDIEDESSTDIEIDAERDESSVIRVQPNLDSTFSSAALREQIDAAFADLDEPDGLGGIDADYVELAAPDDEDEPDEAELAASDREAIVLDSSDLGPPVTSETEADEEFESLATTRVNVALTNVGGTMVPAYAPEPGRSAVSPADRVVPASRSFMDVIAEAGRAGLSGGAAALESVDVGAPSIPESLEPHAVALEATVAPEWLESNRVETSAATAVAPELERTPTGAESTASLKVTRVTRGGAGRAQVARGAGVDASSESDLRDSGRVEASDATRVVTSLAGTLTGPEPTRIETATAVGGETRSAVSPGTPTADSHADLPDREAVDLITLDMRPPDVTEWTERRTESHARSQAPVRSDSNPRAAAPVADAGEISADAENGLEPVSRILPITASEKPDTDADADSSATIGALEATASSGAGWALQLTAAGTRLDSDADADSSATAAIAAPPTYDDQLYLPLTAAAAADPAAHAVDADFSDETSPGLGPPAALKQPVSGLLPTPRPVLLLLVSDAVCAARVRASLTEPRFSILHAASADAAVRSLHDAKPDLALVAADLVSQPEVDLVRRLKSDPLAPVQHVQVLLAEGASCDQTFLDQAGADGALHEPLTAAALEPLVRGSQQLPAAEEPAAREGSIDEIAAQIAEEIRRGIAESLRTGKHEHVRVGDGSQLMAAAWSAIGRVRSHLADSERGRADEEDAQTSPRSETSAEAGRIPSVHPSQLLAGCRVLVADDDPAVLWFFVGLLREASAHVLQAHNGREALELARRKQPHVIVSDILMPRLDGFGLCRELKRDALLSHVPVILLSWKDDLLQRMRELDAGAAGYLRKEAGSQQILAQLIAVLQPRARLVAKLRGHGEVVGSLADLGALSMLELVAAERADARIGVRDAWNLFEVEIRAGRRLSVTRTAADGAFTRGEKALMQLLGLAGGEFQVSSSAAPLKAPIPEPLDRALAAAGRRLSALLDAVSDARLLRVCLIAFDDDVLQSLLSAPSTRLHEVVALFRTGLATAEGVLREGRFAPGELEDYLRELARCVAITGVWDASGEDLVAAAQRERETPQLALLSSTLPPRTASGSWSLAPEVRRRATQSDPLASEAQPIAAAADALPNVALRAADAPAPARRSSVPPPIIASSKLAVSSIDADADDRVPAKADSVAEALPPSAAGATSHANPGIGPASEPPAPPDWLKPASTTSATTSTSTNLATIVAGTASETARPKALEEVETDAISKAELESFDLPIPSMFARALPDRADGLRLAGTLLVLAGVGYFGWQQFILPPEQARQAQTEQTRVEAAKSPPPATIPEEPPIAAPPPLPAPQPAQPTIQNTQFGKVLPFVDASRGVAVGPDQGLLVVEFQGGSEPAPNIRIGARELGKAPLALALPAGRHELVVRTAKSTSFRYLIVRAGETRIVSVPLAEL